jgi:hypothetical protein
MAKDEVLVAHDELVRYSNARLEIGPISEIGIVLLLVALTWFLVAV